jgi:hypothetical protein
MKTLIIRIRDRSGKQGGFPITLHEFDPLLPGAERQLERDILNEERTLEIKAAVDAMLDNAYRSADDIDAVGVILHELIDQTRVGQLWGRMCGEANENAPGVHLRTYLDIQPAQVRTMPWELMLAGDNAVFISRGHRVLRGAPDQEMVSNLTPPLTLPIRVLVVLCRQQDADDAYANSDVDAVYAGLGSQPGIWQIEVLRGPDRSEVTDRMDAFAPQILHIIGSPFRPDSQDFSMEQPGKAPWRLAIDDIAASRLESPPPPRLLILDSCPLDPAMPPDRLRRLGTRAVLTMQPMIPTLEAGVLTRCFYSQLAKTSSLEEAVWFTRRALNEPDGSGGDWGRLALTVYGSVDEIIRPDLQALKDRLDELKGSENYQYTGQLVDRIRDHMKIWGKEPAHPDRKVTIVFGPAETGKSELIRSCMLTWELRGVRTLLVDMKAQGNDDISAPDNLDTRIALQRICHKLLEKTFSSDPDPVKDRLVELAHRLAQSEPIRVNRYDAELYAAQFDELLSILASITEHQPLLLILDHLEKIAESDRRRVIERFFQPIARKGGDNIHELDQVYVIAAVAKEALDVPREGSVDRVELQLFERKENKYLGREFGARLGWLEDMWRIWVDTILSTGTDDWSPALLASMAKMYRRERGDIT